MTNTIWIVVGAVVVVAVAAFLIRTRSNTHDWVPPTQSPLPPTPGDGGMGNAVKVRPTVPPPNISADDEVWRLVAAGNKIAAIKRVRELTGMGLKEAKDYVEALPSGPPLMVAAAPAIPDEIDLNELTNDMDLMGFLLKDNKIAAIKRVRELTGLGLKEAKDLVESLNGK